MIITPDIDSDKYYIKNDSGEQVVLETEKEIRLLSPSRRLPFTIDGHEFVLVHGKYPAPNREETIKNLERVVDKIHKPPETAVIHTGNQPFSVFRVNNVRITAYSTGEVKIEWFDVDDLSDEQIDIATNGNRAFRFVKLDDPIIEEESIIIYVTNIMPGKKRVRGKITYGNIQLPFEAKNLPDLKYATKRLETHFTIVTPEGKKRIPLKYAKFVPENFVSALFRYADTRVKEGNTLVPRRVVKIGDKIISYVGPKHWRIETKKSIVTRWDNRIFRKVPCSMKAEACFESTNEKWYFNVTLPTGQTVPIVKVSGEKARVYAIVTPEGIYTLDTTTERLSENKTISIFESGIEVVAVHFPFLYRIPFKTSVNAIDLYEGPILRKEILIDDKVIALKKEKTMQKAWEQTFEDFNVSNTDVITEYGLV